MLFKFILTINDKIMNLYGEKPLHFNTVLQRPTSTNYYQGAIVRGNSATLSNN